jgi:hypothetical protein
VADETASTTTSEATTAAAAETAAVATDAVETTALGGAGEEAAATAGAEGDKAATEGTTEGAKEGDAAKEGEGDKEGEAKAGPPDAYELTAPEGMALDKESLDAAAPVFRELGLSNEQAQSLMPVAGKFAQKIADGLNQQILTQVVAERKGWREAAEKDPEIGGANWDKSIATAAQGLDRLGFPKGSPLRNLLDESGLGNHPDMIRAWARVGKAVGEDSDFVRPEQNASVKKSDAELFYGTSPK